MNKRNVLLTGMITGIFISIAATLLYYSFSDYREYDRGDETYHDLAEEVIDSDDTDNRGTAVYEKESEGSDENPGPHSATGQQDDVAEGKPETLIKDQTDLPTIDFEALKAINGDVIGWIYAPDSEINYPIVKGSDDEFYLDHLFDGSKNKNGCLFVEQKNNPDFSDDNTVIYGHNMASGSMLAGILRYEKKGYIDTHPYMFIFTEDKNYRMEILSGYVTEPESEAYKIRLGGAEGFRQWILDVAKKSAFNVNMKLTTKDRMVTLSTCSYEYKNARFVLHGRLVEM